ncbi:hypothetical protein ETW23_18495 [Leisingera sp. NJS201]|uniref:hypothetical protein n=1 Tax=Leisingera sp. NJS201 TaxID=2508306 RepID=UPI0010713E7E|nr:hypothetical protein ETW23_18495 [Leisingera sp. NJS201]
MELVFAAVLAGQGTALLPSLLTEVHFLAHLIPNWSADPVLLTLLCRPERLAAPQVAAVRRHILDACGNSDFLGTEHRDEKVLQLTKARFGPVPLSCRPKCSFKPLSVQTRQGFSSPMLSDGGADCRSH